MPAIARAEKDPAAKEAASAAAATAAATAAVEEKDPPVARATALPDAPTPDAAVTTASEATYSSSVDSDVTNAGQQARAQTPAEQPLTGLGKFLYPDTTGKYATVIQPGMAYQPLSPGEKFIYSVRESVVPGQLLISTVVGGVNHLWNSDPKYGTNSEAFGQRVGAAIALQASNHIISDGIYAAAFHQDERYFRIGRSKSGGTRVKGVIASIFMTRGNNGHAEFDYSGILGRATGSALTMAYYPAVSANGTVAAKAFGYALLGELGANAYLEFWPDVWQKMFHRNSN